MVVGVLIKLIPVILNVISVTSDKYNSSRVRYVSVAADVKLIVIVFI
jgi:hypothetical protein